MFKLLKWELGWFEQADALNQIAPDWDTELQILALPKDHFVAMSMGCTMAVISGYSKEARLIEPGKSIVMDIFNKRLRIINSNIPEGSLPDFSDRQLPHYCRFRETTQWAYDHGWELPKAMLRLISRDIKKDKALSTKYPRSNPNWRLAHEYKSAGLAAFYEFIEKNYFDSNGQPIYDKEKLPVKKSLVSEWLKGRTLLEADTIITSGRRKGKAEK